MRQVLGKTGFESYTIYKMGFSIELFALRISYVFKEGTLKALKEKSSLCPFLHRGGN